MALGHGRVATNNFATADFIVDSEGLQKGATHTTIQGAIDDASSGDTIYIKPGTYTENLTLSVGLNIAAIPGQNLQGNVIIVGKVSQSATGTSTFANIRFQTNSDNIIEITGSGSIQTSFTNCSFFLTDGDGISINNSSASLDFKGCYIHQTANTLDYFNITSCDVTKFLYCQFFYSAAALGTSTVAAGTVEMRYCTVQAHLFTTSATGVYEIDKCDFDQTGNNQIFTTAGTGTSYIHHSTISSGTSSAVSIGAGTTVSLHQDIIKSSNANVITGAGTLEYADLSFSGSSSGINTTTLTAQASKSGATTGTSFTADPTSGDSYTQYSIGGTGEFRVGVDDDDSDKFKISQGSALGTNDTFVVTAAGEITKPLQPAFLAQSATQSNVTGDGTTYTAQFTSEIFDQGSDFDGTSTFTAPVTGRYQLDWNIEISEFNNASHVRALFNVVTSNRTYTYSRVGKSACEGGFWYLRVSGLCDMDAADTATCTVNCSGSSKTVDIVTNSYFSGHLVC